MTNPAAVLPDTDADIRWRDWQARGAAQDRRSSARMRKLILFAAAMWIAWFVGRIV